MALLDRVRSAWNAFAFNERKLQEAGETGVSYHVSSSYGSHPPARARPLYTNERSIVGSVYTRISMDVSGIGIRHAKLDEFGRFKENMSSPLNNCLTLEPNLDQSPRALIQEIVTTMFDKGVAAVVPVDTNRSPENFRKFDIYTLRVGHIVDWFPKHVRVSLYNEVLGRREEIVLEKRYVAIVENPLYGVMNEPNSTLQRLIRKLTLLDAIDEQSGSGKLDLIIQLPYTIKSEARRQQAEQRRSDIELQLKDSQYGIAYTDGTEKITQLNRPAENNLMGQVEFLVNMLYGQLGITEEIMNGTADEKTMLNYYNRTVEPIIEAIIQAMQRSFVGPQDKPVERIMYFRDPFKLVPLASIAEIADKFTRNEILTANEIRGFMGIPPANDPKADKLINSNMPQEGSANGDTAAGPSIDEMNKVMNDVFDGLSKDIDALGGGSQSE